MSYKISGTVIKGDGYGKKLGFPTINLDTDNRPAGLAEGVYSGIAILAGKEYRAGIVIGPNGKNEAHLIGYTGNAYGEDVMLELEKFLRPYKKFNTEEELINQIKEDLKLC
ncbi:riboflavin kinase [Candidatus Nomurabacteria bacterium]|nr:riboflavin kinase [Candidatus Nomurabacteria bacterium]